MSEVVTIYDPPSGWMYGFPKIYKPIHPLESLETTLRRDGYPEHLLPTYGVRFWTTRLPEGEEE